MNKAQDIIEKVRRYQFWILCGLVTVIAITSWWLATSSLADTYSKNKSKIESEAGKIGSVRAVDPHPNASWNVDIEEQVKKDKEEVKKAWERLYAEQKAKVYVWPVEVLGEDGVDAVKDLPPDGTLDSVYLNRYHNQVLMQFRNLAERVDADYVDPSQSSGGLGSERGAPVAQLLPNQAPRKVVWLGQAELQQEYVWEQPPTTIQVLYAQEELWVIKAICEAIIQANADSAGAHDAAVRIIESMSVGYWAAEEHPNGRNEVGRITKIKTPVAAASSGGYGSAGGGYGSADGGPSGGDTAMGSTPGGSARPQRPNTAGGGRGGGGYGGGGYGGVTSDTAATATVSENPADYLKEWRYVNANSEPLRAADLANPPFHEYRLMPWRLKMTVDQRKWDKVLVMFRNTDLPLEVRQVRINPTDGAGGAYGGRGEGGSSGGYGSTSSSGSTYSSSGGYGATGSRGESPFAAGVPGTSETLTLELRGVAYLINPPDFSKIGVAGTTTPADAGVGAAAAAAPAATAEDPFAATPVAAPGPAAAPTPVGPPPGSSYGSGR